MRFLHTADWQLGMTRAFLPSESRARYADDQIAAIRKLAQIANEKQCSFVVVAGDVFDSLQVERRVLSRSLDAFEAFTVPVYLLPGNHDADNPSAVWSTAGALLPPLITVLRTMEPIEVSDIDAEVVGAPWPSVRPDTDLLQQMLAGLRPPPPGVFRVAVGHGAVDSLNPDQSNPALISLTNLEHALDSGLIHYVALGDRHSVTEVRERIWYSGAPIATDYDEIEPNRALIVELEPGKIQVERVQVGGWHFTRQEFELSSQEAVELLWSYFDGLPEKDRTVIRLALKGTLSLSVNQHLEDVLDRASDLLAALVRSEARSDLLIVADDADLAQMDLSGFASGAVHELAELAAGQAEEGQVAKDALMLLHRLAARRA